MWQIWAEQQLEIRSEGNEESGMRWEAKVPLGQFLSDWAGCPASSMPTHSWPLRLRPSSSLHSSSSQAVPSVASSLEGHLA